MSFSSRKIEFVCYPFPDYKCCFRIISLVFQSCSFSIHILKANFPAHFLWSSPLFWTPPEFCHIHVYRSSTRAKGTSCPGPVHCLSANPAAMLSYSFNIWWEWSVLPFLFSVQLNFLFPFLKFCLLKKCLKNNNQLSDKAAEQST